MPVQLSRTSAGEMSLRQALDAAVAQLAAASESPRLDAELLLAQVLGLSRGQLLARGEQVLDGGRRRQYAQLLRRRAAGEPVAYLTGRRGFWTLDLEVSPAVLVPRPETELLVEWGLELLQERPAPEVLDLGTGSGAIALALASERADARVLATDRSEAALAVARANAARLGLHLEFARGDWFEACIGRRFELIVSNPPYVAGDDPRLAALQAEPRTALTPGGDGLGALRCIVAAAPGFLRGGGRLLLEHGAGQGAAVRALLAAAGFTDVRTRRDLAGHERASGGRRP